MDMSDEEIENFLRQPGGTATSTPAVIVRPPPCRVYEHVDDRCPTPLPSKLQHVDDFGAKSSVTEKERCAVEMLQELQRRHQELEVTLAEERGRRKACQEMMERSAILQSGPASGPDREPGRVVCPVSGNATEPANQWSLQGQVDDGRLRDADRRSLVEAPVTARAGVLVQLAESVAQEAPRPTPAPIRRVAATLKLGAYNGTTPLDTFLAKVSNCREYYEWSEKDTVHHLRASLEGSAAQVLIDCDGTDVSLSSITSLLRTRFGDQNQTERFRSELSMRRRAKGEPLQAVYQDIRRLVALAFPGQSGAKPGSVYEIVARDAFLVAIDNPAIRRRILERDPPPDTLDAALTAAVRLEALDSTEHDVLQSVFMSDRSTVKGNTCQSSARTQSVLVGSEKVPYSRANDDRLKALESGMAAIQAHLQELSWYQNTVPQVSLQPVPLSAHAAPWVPPQPQAVNWQTNAEGAVGNVVQPPAARGQNPASRPGVTYAGRGGGGRLPKDVCKLCYRKGHWGKECPTKGAAQPNGQPEVAANTREVHSTSVSSDSYVEISIKGKRCNALIDTGSDRSLIPRRLVASVPLEKSDIKLYAANGTEIANMGTMILRYQLEGITLQTELVVSDEIDELIFGYDWLIAHDCRWHFKERIVFVHGTPVGLRTRHTRANVRRVYVREDVTVAPGMEGLSFLLAHSHSDREEP